MELLTFGLIVLRRRLMGCTCGSCHLYGRGRRRRIDEYVHLLSDVDRQLAALERVYHLQHARVYPLGAVAGQRTLRYNVGLDVGEFQGRLDVAIAANARGRGRVAV